MNTARIDRNTLVKITCMLMLLLFPGPVRAQSTIENPGAVLPAEGSPGEVLMISLEEDPGSITHVILTEENGGRITSGKVFELKGRETILLALPPTLRAGIYELRAYDGEENQLTQIEFTVLPKLFREEHINLNSELTLLRTTEEDRKREEALEIQALYALFNPESVFGDLSFISPIRFDTLDYFRVSSEYGDRRLFQYSNEKSSRAIHTGIDMAAREGVEVYAAAPGRVVLAKDRIISGMSVVLEHLPGVYSIYFHLDSIQVEAGEMVEQAQVIGTIGMSGLATGPHLHWEVRVNGVAVDPRPLTQVLIPDTIHATGIGE